MEVNKLMESQAAPHLGFTQLSSALKINILLKEIWKRKMTKVKPFHSTLEEQDPKRLINVRQERDGCTMTIAGLKLKYALTKINHL